MVYYGEDLVVFIRRSFPRFFAGFTFSTSLRRFMETFVALMMATRALLTIDQPRFDTVTSRSVLRDDNGFKRIIFTESLLRGTLFTKQPLTLLFRYASVEPYKALTPPMSLHSVV